MENLAGGPGPNGETTVGAPLTRILKYYWVRFVDDGETVETMFDSQTGEQRPWDPAPENISKVMWYPFDGTLAAVLAERGVEAVPVEGLQPITLDVPDGTTPICKLVGKFKYGTYYHCTSCGANLVWDGSCDLVCPVCNAKNEWYCSRCKEIKDNPKFYPRGEVRCSDCDTEGEAHGLERIKTLVLESYTEYETIYVLGIEGHYEIWAGEDEISLKVAGG